MMMPYMVNLDGCNRIVCMDGPGHDPHRVLFYDDGTVRFEHRCDRWPRGVIVYAPVLQLGRGHEITSDDPLTITPSILCQDCGTYGSIRDGKWVQA